jgi:hypothetical protein
MRSKQRRHQRYSETLSTEKENDQKGRRQDRRHHRRHRRNWVGYGKAIRQGGCVRLHHGRRQKELDEAVKAIGSNISSVQGDVAKLTDLDRLYETVAEVKGRITFSLTLMVADRWTASGAFRFIHYPTNGY